MSLTNLQIQKAKPKEKQHKLSDGRGMYLIVSPRGGKYWRLDYRFNGKRQTLSLGTFPSTSLKDARRKCEDTKSLIEDGIDPSHQRKIKLAGDKDSFEAVAKEWYGKYRSQWTENHAATTLRRIEANLLPWLGSRPIAVVEPPEILQALRRIEKRGSLETAHRVQQIVSRIFRYGVATGRCTRDPTIDLKGALPPTHSIHFPTITKPSEIGALLRAIDGYQGSPTTQLALQMAPLVFVRPGELRHCEWTEIRTDEATWQIPAAKMKMRRDHIVPLSLQTLRILEELKLLAGTGTYVFPSTRSVTRPMSENTVNGALRRLGYTNDEFTGHSFRSMASTILNENSWNRDAIERQLAHVEGNSIRAAYNYAEHLEERRRMMQWWADYLDGLKNNTLPPKPAA
jgi:integrase